MSEEKPSKLGQQLPTSEQLQAAIGPELRALARQALEQKGEDPPSLADILEPPSKSPRDLGKKEPIVQKTVPLAFPVAKEVFAQAAAQAQAAVVPGVVAPASRVVAPAPAPSAVPAPTPAKKVTAAEQAKRDAPTAKVARKKSSVPAVLLFVTGVIAIGAAGGAVWQAKKMGAATAAQATTPTSTSTEGAVKFAVPARPADDPAPPPADTTPPAEVKPADPPPPVTAAAVDPAPPTTAKPDPTAGKASDPKPVHHTHVASAPASPPPQAPVAAAEPKKAPEAKPAAAPPTAAPSVDAILQQQLKSAIP